MNSNNIYAHHIREETLLRSFREVAKDLVLEQQGYHIYFAVDFSEIFLYAHPLSHTLQEFLFEFESTPSTLNHAQALSRQQTTLSLGFHYIPSPLVLLPPYANELRLHLRAMRRYDSNSFVTEKNLELIEFIRISLLESLNEETHNDINRVQQNKYLTTNQKERLASILEEKYRDIWTLLTIDLDGFKNILRLFETNKILLTGEVFKDIHITHERVSQGVSGWLASISAQQGRKMRSFQNYADAYACRYLYTINEELLKNRAQKRSIIVLLSHSTAMNSTLTQDSFANIPGWPKGVSPVRNLRYLYTRLLCSDLRDKGKINSSEVYKHLREIGLFIGQIKMLKEQVASESEFAKVQMNTMRALQNAERNLSLFAKTEIDYLEQFKSQGGTTFSNASGMNNEVLSSLLDSEEFKAELEVRSKLVSHQITEINKRLATSLSKDIYTREYEENLKEDGLFG